MLHVMKAGQNQNPTATCQYAFTAPASFSGDNSSQSCSAPSSCSAQPSVSAFVSHRLSRCPDASRSISIELDRTKLTVGVPVTLPNADVRLSYNESNNGTRVLSCYSSTSWIGSVTLVSDVPAWKIRLNATCAKADDNKPNFSLTGEISGAYTP